MKVSIRKNIFETNSSSVHAICIANDPKNLIFPSKVTIRGGEFGWMPSDLNTTEEKISYIYTALNLIEDEWWRESHYLQRLKNILDSHDIPYKFEKDPEYDNYEDYYIDHESECLPFIEEIFEDGNEDKLERFLFNPDSIIITGNDNNEEDYPIVTKKFDGEVFWKYN